MGDKKESCLTVGYIGTMCRMIHGTKEGNWGMRVYLMQKMRGTMVLSVDNRV